MTAANARPVWVDAQLPPALARRLAADRGADARHVFDFGAHTASDRDIFNSAREANAIIVTKDGDFARLLERLGPPPCIVWLTIGNFDNDGLWSTVSRHWDAILDLIDRGEALIEIR